MYAKLINGKLTPAPANLCKDGTVYQNYNLESNAAMLLADGYKPVAEMPAPDEMKKPKKYYVENENMPSSASASSMSKLTSNRITGANEPPNIPTSENILMLS